MLDGQRTLSSKYSWITWVTYWGKKNKVTQCEMAIVITNLAENLQLCVQIRSVWATNSIEFHIYLLQIRQQQNYYKVSVGMKHCIYCCGFVIIKLLEKEKIGSLLCLILSLNWICNTYTWYQPKEGDEFQWLTGWFDSIQSFIYISDSK